MCQSSDTRCFPAFASVFLSICICPSLCFCSIWLSCLCLWLCLFVCLSVCLSLSVSLCICLNRCLCRCCPCHCLHSVSFFVAITVCITPFASAFASFFVSVSISLCLCLCLCLYGFSSSVCKSLTVRLLVATNRLPYTDQCNRLCILAYTHPSIRPLSLQLLKQRHRNLELPQQQPKHQSTAETWRCEMHLYKWKTMSTEDTQISCRR